MSSSNPPAEGQRVDWEDVPAEVRADLEARLGDRVVAAVTQPAGFSPGLASRVRLANGRRFFLKAVSEAANPDSPRIHRREARIMASLPASVPAPQMLWSYDQLGWVALCFEDVEGRHPYEPWTESDLSLVIDSMTSMSRALTPSPIEVEETASQQFERSINGWNRAQERGEQRLDPWALRNLERLANLERRAPELTRGGTLLHTDIRADNLLIATDRVYFVDWPWAVTGAAFVDWVAMAPSVAMQGGPAPEDFLDRFDVRGLAKESIDAVLCSLAGYFAVGALAPPPPGIPTVRAFQAAQGVVSVRWLRERLGWE